MLAALSTGGVYRTSDGGESWEPANKGVKAEFMPGERNFPEFGQCVHKVARDPADPDRLFLQNHGGVYRSDDGGDSWQDIAPGLPSEFGFAMVTHPRAANTAYNFPIDSAGARWPVDGKARVCRTTDGGATWEALGEGSLPDGFYAAVMRDAMCADDHEAAGLYFGGRNGARVVLARRGPHLAGDPQGPARRDGRAGRRAVGTAPWLTSRCPGRRPSTLPPTGSTRHLDDFREWQKWSPWEGLDPDLKRTFTGPGDRRRLALRVGRQQEGRRGHDGDHRVDALEGRDRPGVPVPFKASNVTTFELVPVGAGRRTSPGT